MYPYPVRVRCCRVRVRCAKSRPAVYPCRTLAGTRSCSPALVPCSLLLPLPSVLSSPLDLALRSPISSLSPLWCELARLVRARSRLSAVVRARVGYLPLFVLVRAYGRPRSGPYPWFAGIRPLICVCPPFLLSGTLPGPVVKT